MGPWFDLKNDLVKPFQISNGFFKATFKTASSLYVIQALVELAFKEACARRGNITTPSTGRVFAVGLYFRPRHRALSTCRCHLLQIDHTQVGGYQGPLAFLTLDFVPEKL